MIANAHTVDDRRVASRKLSGPAFDSILPATAWVRVSLLSFFVVPQLHVHHCHQMKKTHFVGPGPVPYNEAESLHRCALARATAAQYVELKVAQIRCRANLFLGLSFKLGCCFYKEMGNSLIAPIRAAVETSIALYL